VSVRVTDITGARVVKASRRLTPTQKLVWLEVFTLASVAQRKGDERGCYASAAILADRIGLPAKTVATYRTRLKALGLLEGTRGRKASWWPTLPDDCVPRSGTMDDIGRARDALDTRLPESPTDVGDSTPGNLPRAYDIPEGSGRESPKESPKECPKESPKLGDFDTSNAQQFRGNSRVEGLEGVEGVEGEGEPYPSPKGEFGSFGASLERTGADAPREQHTNNSNHVPGDGEANGPPGDTAVVGILAGKRTWITPYLDLWETAMGGEPPLGQLLKAIGALRKKHDETEILGRMETYLLEHRGDRAAFVSPQKFAQTFGQWEDGNAPAFPEHMSAAEQALWPKDMNAREGA
jgi:hypothetical protein